jgi:hypothetical protein
MVFQPTLLVVVEKARLTEVAITAPSVRKSCSDVTTKPRWMTVLDYQDLCGLCAYCGFQALSHISDSGGLAGHI